MALNEDWTNLADHYDTFERKANWARQGAQGTIGTWFTIIATLLSASVVLFLFLGVTGSFQQDKWLQAFSFMVLLLLAVMGFKHILRLTAGLLQVAVVVGLLCWVGSCAHSAIAAKAAREATPQTTVQTRNPGDPEIFEVERYDAATLRAETEAEEESDTPPVEEQVPDLVEEEKLPSYVGQVPPGWKMVPCSGGILEENAFCLVKEPK